MKENNLKYPFLDLRAVNDQYIERLKQAACKVIESGRYIGGEEVDRFNSRLARICHASHAIGVSNGLDALRLIFEGYKILGQLKESDEIIVPANTYIASLLAITQAGLRPVPVDPDPITMNLSGAVLAGAITPATRAILTVDLYGRMAWDAEMERIARKHNLLVIEDAAQAIGARASHPGLSGSHQAGAIGHAGAFSFYPTKNVGAIGDAGAVVTHDDELAKTIRALANYGSDRRYHNIYCGFNCRLDPMQAAMLTVKLDDLDTISQSRRSRAATYSQKINSPLVTTPQMPDDPRESVWHQYVVTIDPHRRQDFIDHLATHGIGTDIHYPTPPHLQPCYKDLAHGHLPVAEQLAQSIVSLPMGDNLSTADVEHIASIINSFR